MLPAAVEAAARAVGWSLPSPTPMPLTYGDAALPAGRDRLCHGSGRPLTPSQADPADAVSAAIGERSPDSIPQARRCSWASVRFPTPRCCAPADRAGCASGRRCSATASWPSKRRAPGPRHAGDRLLLFRLGASCTRGSTATRGCGCAHREDQRSRPHRRAARRHDVDQRRPGGRPVRPGQRRRVDARVHSGFGGQTDFIVGALHSAGGHAVIALRSWHPKADVSSVVPLVYEPVTSFQHSHRHRAGRGPDLGLR